MDYRELLRKYIEIAVREDGAFLAEEMKDFDSWTKEELEELNKIENEVIR